jgi:cupin fold WbuC family metalloprotein
MSTPRFSDCMATDNLSDPNNFMYQNLHQATEMKTITLNDMQQQSETAASSPRLRAHRNFHPELSDPVQRLAIAMEPGTYVRPHRHPHTFELLFPLSGRFVVLNFDNNGTVTHRVVLGEECKALEMEAGTWHAVLSLDNGGVIFEVKHGGYQPVPEQDSAPWAPAEGQPGTAELMKWYAQAQVGDSAFTR